MDSLPRVQGKAQSRVKTNLFGRDNQGFVRFHASLHYHIFLWLLFPTQQICMLRTALQAAQMQGLLVPGEKWSSIHNKKCFKLFKHVSVCQLTISPIYQGPSKTVFSIPWGSVPRHPPMRAGAEFPPRHKMSPGALPRLPQLLQKALPSPPLPTDAVISAVQSPSSFHPSTLSSRCELNSP